MGTNRYAYSFNDPVNLSDPNGNATLKLEFEISAGALGYSGGFAIGVAVSVPDPWTGGDFDLGIVGSVQGSNPSEDLGRSLGGLGLGGSVNVGAYEGSVRDREGRAVEMGAQVPVGNTPASVAVETTLDANGPMGEVGVQGGSLGLGLGYEAYVAPSVTGVVSVRSMASAIKSLFCR